MIFAIRNMHQLTDCREIVNNILSHSTLSTIKSLRQTCSFINAGALTIIEMERQVHLSSSNKPYIPSLYLLVHNNEYEMAFKHYGYMKVVLCKISSILRHGGESKVMEYLDSINGPQPSSTSGGMYLVIAINACIMLGVKSALIKYLDLLNVVTIYDATDEMIEYLLCLKSKWSYKVSVGCHRARELVAKSGTYLYEDPHIRSLYNGTHTDDIYEVRSVVNLNDRSRLKLYASSPKCRSSNNTVHWRSSLTESYIDCNENVLQIARESPHIMSKRVTRFVYGSIRKSYNSLHVNDR